MTYSGPGRETTTTTKKNQIDFTIPKRCSKHETKINNDVFGFQRPSACAKELQQSVSRQ